MKFLIRFVVFISLVVLGCDDKSESPGYPDLRTYLNRFEEEAKARGYDFDLSQVQAVYVDAIVVNNTTYCGYGFSNYDGAGLRRIEFSRSGNCGWLNLTDIQRENFVFHEIGHAFFNRSHDNTMLCDGSVASLMTGGPNYLTVYTEASGDKRDYYIRELIDPLVAHTKCIENQKNWTSDSILYKVNKGDQDWVLYTDNGKYSGTRSAASDPEEYLTLASIAGIDAHVNAYWYKSFNSPNIPECAEVKFKVKINSESLTGPGAAISMRFYESTLTKQGAFTEQYLRVSTEEDPATGELNDVPHELVIPCYMRATSQFIIFVVLLGETKGKVTFNDIEVQVKPK